MTFGAFTLCQMADLNKLDLLDSSATDYANNS